jgi:hypothetical protein
MPLELASLLSSLLACNVDSPLMKRSQKPQENLILADQLSAWATKYKVQGDGYVVGLLEALRNRKDLQIWASLNPTEYLPFPQLESGEALAKWTRFIVVLRNVLVFLPVALTWAAVAEATTAFSEFIQKNGADIVNFLDFWQNGYGMLGEEWRISNVAKLDFVIILVVIILTLLASVFSKKVSELQQLDEKLTDRERILISVEIAAYLYTKQSVSNVTMNQTLARALDKLLNATDSLDDATKALNQIQRQSLGLPERVVKKRSARRGS